MRSLISLCFLLMALLMPLQAHSRDGPIDQDEVAVLSAIDLATSMDLIVTSLVNDNIIVGMISVSPAAIPAPEPLNELFSNTRTFTATNVIPIFARAEVELTFKNLQGYDVLKEPHLARI